MVKNKKIWIIAIVLALVIPELILAFFYYAAAAQDKFENLRCYRIQWQVFAKGRGQR